MECRRLDLALISLARARFQKREASYAPPGRKHFDFYFYIFAKGKNFELFEGNQTTAAKTTKSSAPSSPKHFSPSTLKPDQ